MVEKQNQGVKGFLVLMAYKLKN